MGIPRKPNRIEIDHGVGRIYIRHNGGFIISLVDQEDISLAAQFTWTIGYSPGNNAYAQKSIYMSQKNGSPVRRIIRLHRLITSAPPGKEVDHINHDSLDNRRCNLRIVNKSINQRNRKVAKLIYQHRKGAAWYVQFRLGGRSRIVGIFKTEAEAAQKAAELRPIYQTGDNFGY